MVSPWQNLKPSNFQILSPLTKGEVEGSLMAHVSEKDGIPFFRLTPFDKEQLYQGSAFPGGFRIQLLKILSASIGEAIGTMESKPQGTFISLTISPKWPVTVLTPIGLAMTGAAFLAIFIVRSGTPQVVTTAISMVSFLFGVLRPLLLFQTEKLRILRGLEKLFIPPSIEA